jgi:hypothetical protein
MLTECSRARAAIHASLSGIGRPVVFSSRRICPYISAVEARMGSSVVVWRRIFAFHIRVNRELASSLNQ